MKRKETTYRSSAGCLPIYYKLNLHSTFTEEDVCKLHCILPPHTSNHCNNCQSNTSRNRSSRKKQPNKLLFQYPTGRRSLKEAPYTLSNTEIYPGIMLHLRLELLNVIYYGRSGSNIKSRINQERSIQRHRGSLITTAATARNIHSDPDPSKQRVHRPRTLYPISSHITGKLTCEILA